MIDHWMEWGALDKSIFLWTSTAKKCTKSPFLFSLSAWNSEICFAPIRLLQFHSLKIGYPRIQRFEVYISHVPHQTQPKYTQMTICCEHMGRLNGLGWWPVFMLQWSLIKCWLNHCLPIVKLLFYPDVYDAKGTSPFFNANVRQVMLVPWNETVLKSSLSFMVPQGTQEKTRLKSIMSFW